MNEILYQYEINPTTWIYVSSMLIVGIYFKFNRFWSVRNLDLIGLIAFAPGVLMVAQGRTPVAYWGYLWIFAVTLFFLVRMLVDPMMVRRPLLEPNLTTDGLTFMTVSILVFMVANVATSGPSSSTSREPAGRGNYLDIWIVRPDDAALNESAPSYPPLRFMAALPGKWMAGGDDAGAEDGDQTVHQRTTVRTVAALSLLAIVTGIVLVGWWHFENARLGIAAAALYLLVPYTAHVTKVASAGVDHILPAALLVWAVVAYRYPLWSGLLLGLASAAVYYPVFLLPLWFSFYWHRGLLRFGLATTITLGAVVAVVAFRCGSLAALLDQLKDVLVWLGVITQDGLAGLWGFLDTAAVYRVPVFVTFLVLCGSFVLWPAQKNLGTLLSCSAAIMMATQFWHPYLGGLHVSWYLPLLLLAVFRPNLEDRVALSVLRPSWLERRRANSGRSKVAA